MLTQDQIDEWDQWDWSIIAKMQEEEKEKARKLSSEAVKAARAKIMADLAKAQGGHQ